MKNSEIIVKKPLIIFKTEADRNTNDITLMSNFFDTYIQQLCIYEQSNNQLETIKNITNENLTIINEALKKSEIISTDNITLIPDFENLPQKVKDNLKKGKYKVGTSNQVYGNMRAVILDENNVRVKDITLKKQKNIMNEDFSDKLAIQMQVKEIFNKLTEIQDLQEYQISVDRNRDIIVPFLDAREKIIKAENVMDIDERNIILKDANEDITHALNSIYTNIGTTSNSLAKCVNNPLKNALPLLKNKYMEYLTQDLQIATKYIGVQMQLLDYLNDKKSANRTLEKYNRILFDFFTLPVTKNQMTVADILQDNFPYNKENMDLWYKMKKKVLKNSKSGNKNILDNKEIYVITFDESEDINEEKWK